jgi:hypothetical protein
LRRWLIAALAGCGLVAVAFLPPEAAEVPPWAYTVESGEEHLRGHLRALQSRLRRLELRDSLLASVSDPIAETESGALLVFQDGLPQSVVDTVHALADRQPNSLGVRASSHRVVVAVTARDVPRPYGLDRLTYFLPDATDGRTCLAVFDLARGGQGLRVESLVYETRRTLFLGPCAYYAAFGRPGVHVEEWLASTFDRAAMKPVWTVGALPLDPTSGRIYEVELYACAAGDARVCRSGFFAPEPRWYLRRWVPSLRLPGIVEVTSYYFRPWGLGTNTDRLLSDLLVDMGEERFAVFWSSDGELEAAFSAAFGLRLEDWIMGWAQSQVGEVDRPPLSASVGIIGLVFVLVLAGVTTAVVGRRNVGRG